MAHKGRVVIKIGSSTLTHNTGNLNIKKTEDLIKCLSDIKNSGFEVVIVTSGAVAIGMGKLAITSRPDDIATKQACAAVGQCELMHIYDKMFSEYNHKVSQLLLMRDVIDDTERKQRVVDTLEKLLEMGVIPIINENDTVSIEELVFGDNDTLSAIVSVLCSADKLIILSDIQGLYSEDPKSNPDAKLISTVAEITDEIRSIAGHAGSNLGTGGMVTKIHAAEIATVHGVTMHIINGDNTKNIYKILDGDVIGTTFLPKGE